MNTYYISLSGYIGCTLIYNLKKYNMNYINSPFDNLRIKNISSIINMINESFIDLFNIKYLKFIKIEDNNNFFNFKNKKYTYIYDNIKYNIRFCHDFTTMINTPEFNIELNEINNKYNLLINNFYDIIFNINNNIIFLRHYIKENHCNINNINEFINNLKYFNNNFIIKIYIHNIKNINYEFNINNKYQIINIKKKFNNDWQLDNINWNLLF